MWFIYNDLENDMIHYTEMIFFYLYHKITLTFWNECPERDMVLTNIKGVCMWVVD